MLLGRYENLISSYGPLLIHSHQVTFEVNIITPFKGVTLEVGGAVETYWKSMTVSIPTVFSQSVSRQPKSPRYIDSSRTSPSVQSTVASVKNSHVLSSLKDNYIYVVAQVTRDLHPVAFGDRLLPECGFDIGIADITLDQFEALARRLGRNLETVDSSTDWRHIISGSMISLARLMKVCPSFFTIGPSIFNFFFEDPSH